MWREVLSYLTAALGSVDRSLQSSWRRKVWLQVAAAHGLQVPASPSYRESRPVLRAWAGPIEVRFEESLHNGSRITVVVPGPPGFVGIKVLREPDKPWGATELEVGDELFDRTFYVAGPEWLIRALFDAEARRLLLRANAGSWMEMADGQLRAEMPESRLSDMLPLLLEAGRHFAGRVDILRRLAENAHRDPEAGVRLQNLHLLVRDHPGDPETAEALRTACLDTCPEIRLEAAKELGAEGREVLAELAGNAPNDSTSAKAISILGRELPFDRVAAILDTAVSSRRLLTAGACMKLIGVDGSDEAVRILAGVLAREKGEKGELAVAAAVALGLTGNPAAEAPLLPVLEEGETALQVTAADALAHVGSAVAVLPLKELAGHGSSTALRKAAREAIAEIQDRLQGASPGQLSLAGTEAGQLSLASTEAGQLSLATDPAGRLSLPAPDSRDEAP